MTRRTSKKSSVERTVKRRVKVQWTVPARDKLATLPLKVRRAILDRTKALADGDPKVMYKALKGPLRGYYSIRVSRYRAVYTVEEEEQANGDVLVFVRVLIVLVGIRKAGDKRDIYKLAQNLIRFANDEVDHFEENGEAAEGPSDPS